MQKIKSFCVDHRKLNEGIYISRIDGDIVTYDMRVCKPNTGVLMDNVSMHTTEHMFATFVRNSEITDSVIYFGPMGCQTGFYLLVRDDVSADKVLEIIKDILQKIIAYEGEVFGKSEIECGNYRSLELESSKKVCREYYEKIKDIKKIVSYEEI